MALTLFAVAPEVLEVVTGAAEDDDDVVAEDEDETPEDDVLEGELDVEAIFTP